MDIHKFFMGKAIGFVIVVLLALAAYAAYTYWPVDTQPAPAAIQSPLIGTTWVWESAKYAKGGTVRPKTAGSFSLTLAPDNSFTTTTDCNSMSGTYTVGENGVTFSDVASTKMYCEDSQESDFLTVLQSAGGHHFGDGGELILDFTYEAGSAVFRPR